MAGRPSKYNKELHCKLAYQFALLGGTDKKIAEFLEITESTLNKWKLDHPEFSESLKKGKEVADANVTESLYNRAIGYAHPEEKVFIDKGQIITYQTTKHYPPDTTAIIYWLKNRQPEVWRDKQEIDHTSKGEKIQLPPWMLEKSKNEE
jgi:hypothetical protein